MNGSFSSVFAVSIVKFSLAQRRKERREYSEYSVWQKLAGARQETHAAIRVAAYGIRAQMIAFGDLMLQASLRLGLRAQFHGFGFRHHALCGYAGFFNRQLARVAFAGTFTIEKRIEPSQNLAVSVAAHAD